ncbi:FecR domain-containing protein [Bradyrhizobium sp. WSM 1704]|uniref:FecR domain-containing protein n=1 Tax=Bradyrhizobium semiaridum TaxID=2821404 RepID=UPI001CE23D9D|nr:FecR domain-containing protein [Bradyrhizobium semiaridum]MCA6122251.1 FecR domain-containing protein [Bradyrhizobium semiaridum]
MTIFARSIGAILLYLFLSELAVAQTSDVKCQPVNTASTAQTLRCDGGITITAENGAQYTLNDTNRDGRVDSVELGSQAILLEVPKVAKGKRFTVTTPQAIAAVRGTKWAVDTTAQKTSVFVVNGRVAVARRSGRQSVILGPGEGVDVEGTAPLLVKRWAPARVAALMARLGQ